MQEGRKAVRQEGRKKEGWKERRERGREGKVRREECAGGLARSYFNTCDARFGNFFLRFNNQKRFLEAGPLHSDTVDIPPEQAWKLLDMSRHVMGAGA